MATRVDALAALYRTIAATRMEGIPLLNPVVQVEAVGFECPDEEAHPSATEPNTAPCAAIGILITPWFMNLVCLPLVRVDQTRRVGSKQPRYVGQTCFEFISGHEDALGSYEACSLFSPVFEFHDHATAVATAHAILSTLRAPVPAPETQAPAVPARRAFLLGRSAGQRNPGTGHASGAPVVAQVPHD